MIRTALLLVRDPLQFVGLACSRHTSLAAENLFLRKQLAFYVERKAKPPRLNNAAGIAPVVIPEPSASPAPRSGGHRFSHAHRVMARLILGGLHPEYRLGSVAARFLAE
jgi:hypothetical protein